MNAPRRRARQVKPAPSYERWLFTRFPFFYRDKKYIPQCTVITEMRFKTGGPK